MEEKPDINIVNEIVHDAEVKAAQAKLNGDCENCRGDCGHCLFSDISLT